MRLNWKMRERETGPRAVCAGPRGHELRVDGVNVGSVSANYVGLHKYEGWYWCCSTSAKFGIAHKNTSNEPVADLDAAKDACEAYVRECLKMPAEKRA